MKSWKTTASGIAVIVAALANAAVSMLDNNPSTNPDWNALFVAVAAGVGLVIARDNKVTSEDVGAK